MDLLLFIIYKALQYYYYVLIAYVLMSWIPEIQRTRFYAFVAKLADPYMRLFRGLIVIGMMDFTPIIGFILYNVGLNYFGRMVGLVINS